MDSSVSLRVLSDRPPRHHRRVCNDVVRAWKLLTKTSSKLDEPTSRFALSEEVHLLVVNIDAVETVLLDKSGDGLTELNRILAHRLGSVSCAKDRDHEFHAGTSVARFEPFLITIAFGGPLSGVVCNTKLDRPEGEVEYIESGDVRIRGCAVRLGCNVFVSVEDESRSGDTINVGRGETRVEKLDTRCGFDHLDRVVRLAEHPSEGGPDTVSNASGDAIIVEFGRWASKTIVAVVKTLLVRDGASSMEVGNGSDDRNEGGGRCNAHSSTNVCDAAESVNLV